MAGYSKFPIQFNSRCEGRWDDTYQVLEPVREKSDNNNFYDGRTDIVMYSQEEGAL